MQELKRAEKQIRSYFERFNAESSFIKSIYKTADISEYIARKLSLDEENVELAKVISLLSQIGSFEVEKYNEQDDFVTYGIKVLFDYNLIRKFIFETEYDEIIKKAIYYHRDKKIKEEFSNQELLHTKILHDASKIGALDFFINDAENTDLGIVDLIEKLKKAYPYVFKDAAEDYESISKYVYENFMNNKSVKILDRQTKLDYWLDYLSIIFN